MRMVPAPLTNEEEMSLLDNDVKELPSGGGCTITMKGAIVSLGLVTKSMEFWYYSYCNGMIYFIIMCVVSYNARLFGGHIKIYHVWHIAILLCASMDRGGLV